MTYFEFLPISLALISVFVSMKAFKVARRQNDKLRLVLSVIAAGLLIIAQPAWYSESFIEDFTFLGYIWTLFSDVDDGDSDYFPRPETFQQ